jgi:hypothetical protein
VAGSEKGLVDDQGSQEEEAGLESALEGGGGGGWVLGWEEDWLVSFMSMSINMAISRSADAVGGAWGCVGGEGGEGVVDVGAGVSLEPSGLGDEEACQNQPMVMILRRSKARRNVPW